MANLIEAIQSECNRLREVVLPEYDKIPTGVFAATLMRESIKKAEAAVASGEVVEMVKALDDVKSWNLLSRKRKVRASRPVSHWCRPLLRSKITTLRVAWFTVVSCANHWESRTQSEGCRECQSAGVSGALHSRDGEARTQGDALLEDCSDSPESCTFIFDCMGTT